MLSLACGTPVENQDLSHLELWQDIVRTRPAATALISRHQSPSDFPWFGGYYADGDHVQWTFEHLDNAARKLATALKRLAYIEKRPIAALLHNQAEWALFYWASAYLHSPFVPINPKVATRAIEMQHMLDVVRPAVLVSLDANTAAQMERSCTEKLMASIPVKIILASTGGEFNEAWTPFSDVMPTQPTPPDTPDCVASDDTTVILFTSGTTSLPKPCALTSFQCLNAALGYMDALGIGSNSRFVQHLPGFHSYGIGFSLGLWLRGGTLIYPSATFEPQASLECIGQLKATHMGLVPTTAQAILSHPSFAATDLTTLESIDVSGAGVLPSLVNACTAALKVPAAASYGMTESPGTLVWPVSEGPAVRDGQVLSGRPSRACRVKVCKPGTQTVVPRGEAGELHAGGPQVIARYMDPAVSSDDFYQDADGVRWIVTGDQAIMYEDGAVRISGRYKDMIIRGGENISPASIEEYISRTPDVQSVYVVAAPDEMAGEVPIAVITTDDGRDIDVNERKKDVSFALGAAFAPKLILHLEKDLHLDGFPSTASGKIRKVELARIVREYLEAKDECPPGESLTISDSLISTWESISGTTALLPSTLIDSFADSLMMMQLSGLVKRQMQRDITVEQFKLCKTVRDQAALIESTPLKQCSATSTIQRQGPPTIDDMPHARGDARKYERICADVVNMTDPLGLTWNDVEDVMPLPDWNAIFCHRSRPNSWNLRFCYTASVSAAQLEEAICQSLSYHPTMRAMALPDQDGNMLLVSIRNSKQWQKAAVTSGWEVNSEDDLGTLLLDHPVHDNATSPGPLAKFHIASILEDGTSGLVVVVSHAVADMSMTKLWLEDVLNLLVGKAPISPHALFKDYAAAFFHHRDGNEAEDGSGYWARKLAGISSVPEQTLWPPQRAPEWFKGNDAGWTRWSGTKPRRGERSRSYAEKLRAQQGLHRRVPVEDILRLKAEHGVPVFMLVKAALALLNVSRTGGHEAIFGTINAARTWPFAADYSPAERAAYTAAHNALDISGSTTEYVLDRIPVPPTRPLVAFMQQVTRDEAANSAYAHTPFLRVVDRLRDPLPDDDDAAAAAAANHDRRTFAERGRDADAVLPLIRRQSFNWLPTPPDAADAPRGSRGLRFRGQRSRMDNGLTVTGFLAADKRRVALAFTWDPEHLGFGEAERALEHLASLVERMGRAENWGLTVEELIRG